jgi:glucoside 3-dehydrogenase (cytochrome c) catalytic subunit
VPDFDAIVIGSGMSGGWVAKELCERGLSVLVLERGPPIDPQKDYSDFLAPWQRPNLDHIPEEEVAKHYYVQKKGVAYAVHETTKQFWVKDDENPYETPDNAPFEWLRGYHAGGKSLMWSRQTYRWSDIDFGANKKDGHGVDWPIRYRDLAPWYDHVERFAGISGQREGLAQLPDSVFQPPFDMTIVEKAFKERVERAFPTRKVIHARVAHLTAPTEEQLALGRGQCQSRNYCHRGCSFGAYFSSVAATLPAAARTGKMTLVTNAVVQRVEYDPATRKVSGVKVIDAVTKEGRSYSARLIFVNASTVATTMILLNSTSEAFPNGLANSSGQLGANLMDHFGNAGASGTMPGFEEHYYAGRRPGGIYIPRFANVTEPEHDFVRGYGYQGGSGRAGWSGERAGIGADFKQANRTPGAWSINVGAFGEMLPYEHNRITLHPSKRDAWGMPVPVINCTFGANERAMMAQASKDAKAMLEAAGATNIRSSEDGPLTLSAPGNKIHEMGTARMGRDPAASVLNGWCQAHDVANLFVTDGACMASTACQNPSLTYMALSARAANHAADLVRDGAL